MRRILCLVSLTSVVLVATHARATETITFDESERVGNLGTPLPQLIVNGVTFTPSGVPSPGVALVTPIASFDDRSPAPYPYDFISAIVLQVRGTKLDLEFSEPVISFGFGAALDASFNPGLMRIDLFDSFAKSLGTSYLMLDRTEISQHGGTNSNSEGLFTARAAAGIARVRITNFGDGISPESTFAFVVDNVSFQPIPEPPTLILFAASTCLAVRRGRRVLKPLQLASRK